MLTRLYIDNFRCFEKFEYRPARKQLILGGNGSGKSTLMEALVRLRSFAVDGDRVDELFGLKERTRWLDQNSLTFEIEAELDGDRYKYRLGIESFAEPAPAQVNWEIVECNEAPIFDFRRSRVHFREDSGREVRYPFDRSRSALATISPDGDTRSLLRFRNWLSGVSCFLIDPFAIGSRAEGEDRLPKVNLSNIAAWYRHLRQTYPEGNAALREDLRAVLDDLHLLRLDPVGENVQLLSAEFLQNDCRTKFRFDELSHGQRCLICLYAILHFVVAKGGTVIIDEPENFISLREIQPWLMAADDMADDHKGQVLLISHHPGLIDQWAPSYAVQFVRDGIGPVQVKPFRGQLEAPFQRQNWSLADGSVNKPSRVVVLAEDLRQQRFVRRYLYRLGYTHYQIEFEPPVSGRGSGEQWVRARSARTVLAYRVQTKRVSTALIVVIDSDKGGVSSRQQQFEASLRDSRVTARDHDEPIVHLIPKRNIETWILCLAGTEVDEETDYHDRSGIDQRIDTAAIAFCSGPYFLDKKRGLP